MMQGKNTLIAHCVGAGKTWEMVVASQEMKRVGLIKKPLFVVPQNILKQFEREFRVAYPSAKLLTLTAADLKAPKINITFDEKLDTTGRKKATTSAVKRDEKESTDQRQARLFARRRALSKIATGDWDGVIISHDMFMRLPMSPETYNAFYEQQKELLESEKKIQYGDKYGDKKHQKILSNAIASLEQKLSRDINEEKKEIVIPFEELGIDQIFVDEADMFKNLGFSTHYNSGKGSESVAGISTSNAQRSLDMYIKTKWLTKMRNGGGVTFATGTPISNTLNEIYTMQRYLDYPMLEEKRIYHFDNWAGMFAREVKGMEASPSGNGFREVTRLKLTNLQTLIKQFHKIADIKLPEDLPHLTRPKLKNDTRTVVQIEPSNAFRIFKEELLERAEKIRGGNVDPSEDNYLKIISDFRKASLDMRLIDPSISESEAGAKIAAICDTVTAKYKETANVKGTQLIFSDLSVPKGKDASKEDISDEQAALEETISTDDISVYERIKKGLIKRGIPENQIAFVHEAKNPQQRQALFDRVNNGEIRVIIGSTGKMGAGTNFQKHLVALHHLDCPWRPRDIEQREGRILRSGNQNAEVEIFTYVTKGSYDANMWEKVSIKQSMIDSVLRGDPTIKELDDISEVSADYEDIASTAYENPLMSEEAKLSAQVRRLNYSKNLFLQQQRQKYSEQKKLATRIPQSEQQIKNLKADIVTKVDTKGDAFKMKISDTEYTKRTEAGKAFDELINTFDKTTSTKVGEIGGFDINMRSEHTQALRGGVLETISKRVIVTLSNRGLYSAEPSLRSIEHFISQGIEKLLESEEKTLKRDKMQLAAIEKELAKPFDKQAELDEAISRWEEIKAQIAGDKSKTSATPTESPMADGKQVQHSQSELEVENPPKNPEQENKSDSYQIKELLENDYFRQHFIITGATPIGQSNEQNSQNENQILEVVKKTPDKPNQATESKETSSLNESHSDLDFETGEFTHSKTGEKIPQAKLKDRVDREEYLKLNSLAKKHAGYYSKFSKSFLFPSSERRDAFINEARGKSTNAVITDKLLPDENNTNAEEITEIVSDNSKLYGNKAEVITGSRKTYQVQYRVIEVSELNSSHEIDNGSVFANKNYPAELQPRDRSRADMQAQLIHMGNNLNPADLLDARNVNQGAPVTRNDNVVLNGNGRTAAIRYAYENGKGEPYKNALIDNAQRLGLNADDIAKMNQPILVREITSELTDAELRDLITAQTGGAQLSASEQALADAKKITSDTLSQLPQSDSVDFTNAEFTDFLRAVLNDIAATDERNALTQSDGTISQDGINRVKRALFALAYDDSGLIARMSESTDDNVRGVSNALLTAAPSIAKVQAAMRKGFLHSYDLKHIVDAVKRLSALRDEGKPVNKYLQEQSLFAEHADSAELKEILSFLDSHKRAPNKIANFIKKIAEMIQSKGDPRQGNLFGENEPVPLLTILKQARNIVENNGQANIFDTVDTQRADKQQEGEQDTAKKTSAENKPKYSSFGNGDTSIENFVKDKDLTPYQKLLKTFGKKLGVRVVFFSNKENKDFHGAYAKGVTYLNVNSKMPLGKVFWHESMHWLKANNVDLYNQLVKAVGITDEQRQAYIAETRRKNLLTKEAIDEEIISDMFEDAAKRTGLLQNIAGKNRNLIERVVQWLKDTMDKFIDHFRNPDGGLTTKQAQAFAEEFGKLCNQLVDENGKKIFRYNRRTGDIEVIGRRRLETFADKETSAAFVDNRSSFADNEEQISQKVFDKYLTKGIMQMVRAEVEKEIGKYVNLSKMSDPVERDKVRDKLPSILKMLTRYNLKDVQENEAYKNRLAVRIEYARRCFDNDERIQSRVVRQMDGNEGQRGIRDARTSTVPKSNTRGTGSQLRGINGGVSRSVSGGKSGAFKHFVKLYDELAGHSGRQGAFGLKRPNDNRTIDRRKLEDIPFDEKALAAEVAQAEREGTIKYSFAGVKAKNIHFKSLATAQIMKSRGASSEEIFNETGWFKGKDGKLRFEIPDHREQMNLQKLIGNNAKNLGKEFSLEEIYNNVELFAAYPKLRKVLISSKDLDDDTYGLASADKIFLNGNYIIWEPERAQKTLVHEIQHVIQDYEGFASGGTSKNVRAELERNKKMLMYTVSKIPNGKKYFDSILAVKKAVKNGNEKTIADARREMQTARREINPEYREKIETFAKRFVELSNAKTDTEFAREEAYWRLGGEQEARAVEERLFNHDGIPKSHDEDALIIFGGKIYKVSRQSNSSNKKIAIKNSDGELVGGSLTPPAATANGTTETAVTNVTAGLDNKGGVNPNARVETNSPNGNISQTKFAGNGDLERMFAAAKILTSGELTSQERKWIELGKDLGVQVKWIKAHTDLKGALKDGVIYINRRANESVAKTFWHEQFHLTAATKPELYQELMKYFTGKDTFSKEQLDAYREKNNRYDLSDAEAIEEILCDNFGQVQKRVELMQEMSADNPSLAKKFVAWLKYLADKVAAMFRNPEGGMTTAQRDAFIKGISELADKVASVETQPHTGLKFGRQQTIATDTEYLQAVEDYQNATTDTERQAKLEKLQDMVQQAAEAAGFHNAIPEQTTAYKVRTTASPKKTIKVYKVFTLANDGSPTALFVSGTEKLPQGVWLDAQAAWHFKAENDKYYVPSTKNPFTKRGGKTGDSIKIPDELTRQELIERGFLPKGSKAKNVTALAYRPGWHAGTLPFFPQGGMKRAGSNHENIHRYNQVVFECELAADKDYTSEAEAQPKARNKNGSLNTRNADLQYMPENGFYYYATNPLTHGHPELGMWAISGSLKINRALTQEECDAILAENDIAPQEWEQGELNLSELGYTGEQNDSARKTLAPITYDDDGKIIPLSQRFDATKDDIRFSGTISNSTEKLKTKISNFLTAIKNERPRKHMVKLLEKLSGYQIRTGHVAEGIDILVKDVSKVIRTKRAYDWENILPEVGGLVAQKLNLNPSSEMKNYIASWLMDGEPNNTSQAEKDFQRAMRKLDDVMYRDQLLEVQGIFSEWNNRAPEEIVRDTIAYGKDEKPLSDKAKGFFDEGYAQFVEELYPVQKLINEIEENRGKKLAASENPLTLMRNFRGMAGRAKIMIEGSATAIDALKVALPNIKFDEFKTIRMILESVDALDNVENRKQFSDYLLACSVKDLHRKNNENLRKQYELKDEIETLEDELETLKDKDKIKKTEKRLENMRVELDTLKKKIYVTPFSEKVCDGTIAKYKDKYEQVQKDMMIYSRTLLDIMVDGGLLSEEKKIGYIRNFPVRLVSYFCEQGQNAHNKF